MKSVQWAQALACRCTMSS